MTLDDRRNLGERVRLAVLATLAPLEDTSECRGCYLELPPGEYRPGRRTCTRCEADAAELRRAAA